MKKLELFIVYLICFLIQGSVLCHFSLFGVSPNVILALTIISAFFFENFDGVIMGVIFGLLQDILYSPAIGITALVYMMIGLALQFLRIGVYRDNKVVLFVLTLVCTAFFYLAIWAISHVMAGSIIDFLYVIKKIPMAFVWNYIAVLVVCHFARKKEGFTV